MLTVERSGAGCLRKSGSALLNYLQGLLEVLSLLAHRAETNESRLKGPGWIPVRIEEGKGIVIDSVIVVGRIKHSEYCELAPPTVRYRAGLSLVEPG